MARPTEESFNRFISASKVLNGSITFSATRPYYAHYRYYEGVLTPNFNAISGSRNSLPVNHHYVKITDRAEQPMVRITDRPLPIPSSLEVYMDNYSNMFASSFPDHSWDIAHSTQGYEQAKRRCINKVKAADVNVAQVVAEAQKTMDMVGTTATNLANAFLQFKKGNFKQGMKRLGLQKNPRQVPTSSKHGLSDNWLAIQYGWLPLLSDIHGACKYLAEKQSPPRFRFVGKSTVSDSKQVFVHGPASFGEIVSRELGYKCDTAVMMSFEQENPTQRTMSQLGISDPLLLAWELLPYSFVIDWFLPVGNYLQTLDYTRGLKFKDGYVRQFSQNEWTVICTGKLNSYVGVPATRVSYQAASLITSRNTFLLRDKLTAPLRPSLPQLKNPLSPTHMLNGLALLTKAFR
jgi:hypothetical protein